MHNRRDFLKLGGLASAATLWPFGRLNAATSGDCVLIPTEITGPFPLDLTDNSFYFRTDVREDRIGIPLHLKMKVNGVDDCGPMSNVRVHIWHCDKDGNYSGYGTEVGKTYLRGYQVTDANGEVEFTTIFPGWYPGRTCHFHFQVYVNSSYAAISQFTWLHEPKNELLSSNSDIYTEGPDPIAPESDGAFSDGYAYQTASLTENADGSYDSFLEVQVQGSGTTGYAELQANSRYSLEQNFPNPAAEFTTIPFRLFQTAEVLLEVYDLQGKLMDKKQMGTLPAGKHQLTLNRNEWGFSTGNYMYQMRIRTDDGTFTRNRLMMWL